MWFLSLFISGFVGQKKPRNWPTKHFVRPKLLKTLKLFSLKQSLKQKAIWVRDALIPPFTHYNLSPRYAGTDRRWHTAGPHMARQHETVDYTCRSKYIHHIQTIKTRRKRRGRGGEDGLLRLTSVFLSASHVGKETEQRHDGVTETRVGGWDDEGKEVKKERERERERKVKLMKDGAEKKPFWRRLQLRIHAAGF